MNTRRAVLKSATDAQHRALDARVSMYDLARADEYRAFLEASAAALLPLEALLTASNAQSFLADWPARRRSLAIAGDIAALGGDIESLPLEHTSLTPSQVFGVLYVLEGSRVGGQVLLTRVAPTCAARRYLGAFDAGQWRSFLHTLEHTPAITNLDEAVQAASYAFRVFTLAFDPARKKAADAACASG